MKNIGCEMCSVADPALVKALVLKRRSSGVRAQAVADAMGVSITLLSRMEHGTRRMLVRRAREYEAAVEKLSAPLG